MATRKITRRPMNRKDGSGGGKMGGRNKNTSSCPSPSGPGYGKGGGRGKGANRKS